MSRSRWVSGSSQTCGGAIRHGDWMQRDERRSDQMRRGKQKQRDKWGWQGVWEQMGDWRGRQK